jgi:hypothetical protein
VKTSSKEKIYIDELCPKIARYDDEGSELSIIEENLEVLSNQDKKPSPDERQLDGDHSRSTADTYHLLSRTYGCVVCDKMFEIDKEFMEHCRHHYYENPLKNTFEEFLDLHLLTYFP